ncbi:MAG: cell division protein FtsI/penicillin-binding protein 2 [Acidimicrobiales bacterium]|nr:cell division protein FtsI/penicillin-binding protein 2 [Acidimicrobiales bacterium]
MDRSIRRLGAFLMVLFVVLFVQLNYIQVFRAADLNEKPGNSRPVDLTFSIPRGTVSTADGVVIANSVKSNDRFEYLRQFPEGELYAGLTGYFNFSFGATGLESAYNEELSGRNAEQQIRSVGDLFTSKERTGNLQLTVRSDVQAAAKAALGDRLGSVVALDPQTGGVLAAWSWPSYDPNKLSSHDLDAAQFAKLAYERAPGKPLLPKSYRERYFPGSTFKVVTASTALEAGKVTVNEPSYPVLTALDVPQTDKDLRNFGGSSCGGTLFEIVAKSCNTSFAQMGLDLGEELTAGAERFGFNERPPLDLPAVASTFPTGSFEQRQPVLAQAAIGQNDVAASPLQMALVAGAVANDGVIMEPHVVDEVRDNDNQVVRKLDPTQWKRASSPQTADIMRQAMRQVVGPGGTATRLQIAGLDVGAKTGTAQLGNGTSHAWIIAWAGPVGQKPTVAVAVLVEAQPGASEQTGGRVAAPIAKAVIEAAMKPMPAPPADPGTTTTTTPGPGN